VTILGLLTIYGHPSKNRFHIPLLFSITEWRAACIFCTGSEPGSEVDE
jgi:hypothetical protein